MANDTAWQEGWQLGTERRAEQRAHKQAMSDQEFQEKHDEIQGMIDNLQSRLATVPKDSPDYLKAQDDLAQALQQRDQHWKSLNHPNVVLELGKKLGRDLKFKKQAPPPAVAPPVYGQPTMDVDGQKVATGPAYRVQGPQTPAQVRAQAEALRLSTAAPLSPEEKAQQDARADAARNLVAFQSKLKLYDQQNPHATSPDATEDEKQARQDYVNQLITSISGGGKEKPEKWTDRGTPYVNDKGKWIQLQVAPDGGQREIEMPGDWKPAPLRQSSAFAAQLARALYGPNPTGQQLLDAVSQYKEVSTPSKTTESPVVLWDSDNHPHIFERVTTSKSTFPRAANPQTQAPPVAAGATGQPQPTPGVGNAPTTPKKATQEAPKHGTAPPSSPIGPALDFTKSSPATVALDKDISDARIIDNLADEAQNAPPNMRAEKTRFLLGKLQKVMEGRFNQGAYENLSSRYGWENTFEGWMNHISSGQLPDEVFNAIVSEAHDNLKAAVEAKQQSLAGTEDGKDSSQTNGDMITMKLKDGRTGKIHESQKDRFIHDHPGAEEVTGAK